MAPKQPSPASSSEEEESDFIVDKGSDDEEQEQENKHKKAESEEEEEESEEEEEEEEEETPPIPPPVDKKPSVQKPTPTTTAQSQSSSESEDDEGSDSESESNKTQHSPTASDFTVKPIVSKPMNDHSKTKKPASKSAAPILAPPSKPAAKRPAESDQSVKDSRRKKIKVSNGDEEDGAVEEKKSGINRLWSENDEIAILKGMIDYQLKKGADPYADMGAFLEFIKESLHVDVSKNQLTDKIRRLKKKYQNNAGKGENGEDPVFSRPHEHKSFELSKKIWGGGTSNGVDDSVKSNNSRARKSGKVNNFVAPLKEDAQDIVLPEALKGEVKAGQEDFWSIYPRLSESLQLEKSCHLSLPEAGRNFLKERMSLIGSAKAKELEEQWTALRVEEIMLYSKRMELIQEQTKLVLDEVKSSKS